MIQLMNAVFVDFQRAFDTVFEVNKSENLINFFYSDCRKDTCNVNYTTTLRPRQILTLVDGPDVRDYRNFIFVLKKQSACTGPAGTIVW